VKAEIPDWVGFGWGIFRLFPDSFRVFPGYSDFVPGLFRASFCCGCRELRNFSGYGWEKRDLNAKAQRRGDAKKIFAEEFFIVEKRGYREQNVDKRWRKRIWTGLTRLSRCLVGRGEVVEKLCEKCEKSGVFSREGVRIWV
jgi:hypothetical protein